MVNIKKEVQAKTRAIEQIRRFMSFSFVFFDVIWVNLDYNLYAYCSGYAK